MAEIRTQPVTAVYVPEKQMRHEGLGLTAGAFHVTEHEKTCTFWYRCPCGCGSAGMLIAGNNFKPETNRPSWNWNGSTEKPTLIPSVHHVGHWHGWLTDGTWISC